MKKAIILAGGKGRRLLPYTTLIPKPLIPIGDTSIIEIIIRQLIKHGFEEIIISVNHMSGLMMAFLNEFAEFKGILKYSKEDKPLGTSGAISLIENLDSTFLVMNGDLLTDIDYNELIEFHNQRKSILTIASKSRSVDIDFGILDCNPLDSDFLTSYQEKPIRHYLVSAGIYIFEPMIKKYLEYNDPIDFPELVQKLLDNKENVSVYQHKGFWMDLGRKEDFDVAIQEFDKDRNRFV